MNTSYERLRADMVNWKIGMARRKNRRLLAMIVVGAATSILDVLIAGIPAA